MSPNGDTYLTSMYQVCWGDGVVLCRDVLKLGVGAVACSTVQTEGSSEGGGLILGGPRHVPTVPNG